MSGLNLGRLLQEAGVRGAKTSPLTLAEAITLSHKEPPEKYANEAMRTIEDTPVFKELFEVKNGEEFMDSLRTILEGIASDTARGANTFLFTKHTVFGIIQLAHRLRDSRQGSKRKSFDRIIPKLLKAEEQVEKRQPYDVITFFIRKLWPEPARICAIDHGRRYRPY
jgi:type I restriction-modification system DNA methylase subunit